MKITELHCEYGQNPLGIGTTRPRLSWKLDSAREGARQIAYRIVAASSQNALEAPDLWDCGRVESNQTAWVEYAGQTLKSRQKVWWRVEIEDESGAQISSETASFEIGLLEKSDWSAHWIGGNLVGSPAATIPAPFLRREFSVEKTGAKSIKSARLYASALGLYECEINGVRVGDHVFAPGWTDYQKRVQYQTFDVSDLLRNGENVWGAVLGDGWYCGRVGWQNRQNYGAAPRFLGQLEIEWEDGAIERIGSDENWRFAYGPLASNDLLMGESWDARLDFRGWSAPGFDAQEWRPAPVFAAPDIEISAPIGPPVRAIEEVRAVNVQSNVVDFGQNLVGRVRLKVSGPRGTTIRLRFAETLRGGPKATEGTIYFENLRSATQTDFYTLAGEGEEVWEPRFTSHGFRFVEVLGFPGEIGLDALTAIVLHSDTTKTGDFSCSDELLNQLQRNIDWGQRGNFLDVPTDCPQRDERLGWTGDAQAFVRTASFNRDVAGFFAEWARDVRDAQTERGGVPCVVPNDLVGVQIKPGQPQYDGGPAWADATLICPWTIYQCFGDQGILSDNYDVFGRWMGFLESTSQDFRRSYEGTSVFKGFGDWLALDGSGKVNGGTPEELIGTAFYAYDAALMRQIALVLGKNDDAARYETLFQNIQTAFCARFVTPAGLVFPGTQTAFLLALHFDLLPENLRQNAADALALDIKNRGNKLTTGFAGSPYINHVLTRFGHLETAYALLHQTAWPSWLYAVTQGATTIWERWNGWTHDEGFADVGMNSFNHYAYGAIGDWLYAVVAGIQFDHQTPGYAKFKLAPQPGGQLTSAKAHLETRQGRIESDWKIENGVFEWNFTIPTNTSAQIVAPNGETFEKNAGKHAFKCQMPEN